MYCIYIAMSGCEYYILLHLFLYVQRFANELYLSVFDRMTDIH